MKKALTIASILSFVVLVGCGKTSKPGLAGPSASESESRETVVSPETPSLTCKESLELRFKDNSKIRDDKNHDGFKIFPESLTAVISNKKGSQVTEVHLAPFNLEAKPQVLAAPAASSGIGADSSVELTVELPCDVLIQLDHGCGVNPPPNAGYNGGNYGGVHYGRRDPATCGGSPGAPETTKPSPAPSPVPELTCSPDSQESEVGDPAQLSAQGGRPTYVWYLGGTKVGEGANVSYPFPMAGNFTLEVRDKDGRKDSCKIKVKKAETNLCQLEISKSVDKDNAKPGEKITYSINFTNTGKANCTGGGVEVKDSLNSDLEFVGESHSSNGSWRQFHGRTAKWNYGTVRPGESGSATLVAKAKNGCGKKDILNQATIWSNETHDIDSNTVVVRIK